MPRFIICNYMNDTSYLDSLQLITQPRSLSRVKNDIAVEVMINEKHYTIINVPRVMLVSADYITRVRGDDIILIIDETNTPHISRIRQLITSRFTLVQVSVVSYVSIELLESMLNVTSTPVGSYRLQQLRITDRTFTD